MEKKAFSVRGPCLLTPPFRLVPHAIAMVLLANPGSGAVTEGYCCFIVIIM